MSQTSCRPITSNKIQGKKTRAKTGLDVHATRAATRKQKND